MSVHGCITSCSGQIFVVSILTNKNYGRTGMWLPSLIMYLLAKPKSMMYMVYDFEPVPDKKLSGLISLKIWCKLYLWRKCFSWTYCILVKIWSMIIKTVFKLNFLPQKVKRSSRDGPNKSITIILYSPSVEQ